MAFSAQHLFLFAFAFLGAIAAPRVDAWGGRLFVSKMTRPEAVEPDNKAVSTTATVVPEASDPNGPPAFSRPSSGSNRGYGLYGRPEENCPPAYFRRGVHRDAEKMTTTTNVPAAHEEATVPVEESSGEEGAEPSSFPEDGSGWGRPLSYARTRGRHHGMSDTRLYQNGRYYYDVDTGKYGYGYESNPVRTAPTEENGSGYGRAGGERRPGRYGNAAGRYEYGNGNGNEFGNGVVEKQNNGFEENQNEQYIP